MLSDKLRQEIEQTIKANKIVIYMKGTPEAPMCGFSGRSVGILQTYGVPIKGFNILEDEELRQGIKEFTNWPTIPQIFINGEFVGGCDTLTEMHANNDIAPLLSK